MYMYQQQQPYTSFQSQQQPSSSKHIDPEKIYPKRLGTYQGGNALVLEYYNLASDKFKKHVIPLDRGKTIKQNMDEIYRNPKHALLLRKVQPKYVQAVIKDEDFMSQIKQSSYQQNNSRSSTSQTQRQSSSSYYTQQQISSYNDSYNNNTNSNSQSQYQSNQQSQYSKNNNTSQQQQSQNSVSEIRGGPSSSLPLSQSVKQAIQQVEEYYDEEFEDFQISQSMGKKNNLQGIKSTDNKKQPSNQSSINTSNNNNQSTSLQMQSKYNHQQSKQQQQYQKVQKKQKKSKKSKQGKKSKKKKLQQPQEDQFQFDFLDDDGTVPKKSQSKSKQTSKEKPKKQKSKDKDKSSKDKDDKKTKKQTKKVQEKPKPIQQTIEQDFDFDL